MLAKLPIIVVTCNLSSSSFKSERGILIWRLLVIEGRNFSGEPRNLLFAKYLTSVTATLKWETFLGIFLKFFRIFWDIPQDLFIHSPEFTRTFRGIASNILRIAKVTTFPQSFKVLTSQMWNIFYIATTSHLFLIINFNR